MLWLLIFVPTAFVLEKLEVQPLIVFACTALAIMPLAVLMEKSTEVVAHHLGPTYGGLLNATMGNAPELIIGIAALNNGLIDMLKGSIAGSIIGTLLFGVGITMIAGSSRRSSETAFDGHTASINSSLLIIASFGLIIPAVFASAQKVVNAEISVEISLVLLMMYVMSLVYTLTTHQQTVGPAAVEASERAAGHLASVNGMEQTEAELRPRWSLRQAMLMLAGVATAIAFVSDLLTDSLQPAADALHLNPMFAGVFMLALVGNIPQYMNSVAFARKGQMTLALSINLGSTTQLVLLVAPLLVLLAHFMGKPMNLLFGNFEIVGSILAVFLTRHLLLDNRCNWLEGCMLVGVYIMLAIGFYNAPSVS